MEFRWRKSQGAASVSRIRVGLSRYLDCLSYIPIRGVESKARWTACEQITVTAYRQRHVNGSDGLHSQPDLERSGIAFWYREIEYRGKNSLNLGCPEIGNEGAVMEST